MHTHDERAARGGERQQQQQGREQRSAGAGERPARFWLIGARKKKARAEVRSGRGFRRARGLVLGRARFYVQTASSGR